MNKPRKPIPYNLWAKEHTDEIELAIIARRPPLPAGATKRNRGDSMKLHTQVTRSLFYELPGDVRATWQDVADTTHVTALAEWERSTGGAPSTAPEDRQK